ncbi:hypothetical protein DMH02_016095 [Streptomyces sp. WAC 00631]|uniref:hypothetical protein n=1 Tax=unclassified Streptomyces TaxID=2593676 RepID=UPI00163B6A6E|nr:MULTISPECIES: hypothetical protein [unclassified Streptomyces]MCC5034704.1 hypothetical protein [Streptomyces sp. WAC 00631]MCC9741925.1 hypothetical protein [Streptomyces sp. MNU89]
MPSDPSPAKVYFVLLILLVAGLVTCLAWLEPAFGIALLVGVGAGAFLLQALR